MAEAAEPKHYLIGRIREALAADPRVNELDIQVTVAGRKIFLSGHVATAARRDAIRQAVTELLPDYQVHNEVTVSPLGGTGEVENLS